MSIYRDDENFKTNTPPNATQPIKSLCLTPQKDPTTPTLTHDNRLVNSAPRSTRYRSKKLGTGQSSQRRSLPFTNTKRGGGQSGDNSPEENYSKGGEEDEEGGNEDSYGKGGVKKNEGGGGFGSESQILENRLNSVLVNEENGLNLLSEVASSQQDSEDRKLKEVFNSPARLFKNSQDTNLSLPSLSLFQSQKQPESQPSQPKIELDPLPPPPATAELQSQVQEHVPTSNNNGIDTAAQQINQVTTQAAAAAALQVQELAALQAQQYTQQYAIQQQQQQQQQLQQLQQFLPPNSQPPVGYYGYVPPPTAQQGYIQDTTTVPFHQQVQHDDNIETNIHSKINAVQVKPEHKDSRAVRRGPMDEMRQLVRIMVKIFPQSQQMLSLNEEGAGNKISEDQIKRYLDGFLGDAPKPEWGVPQGWGTYLAQLFSWATGRHISSEDARTCATRRPGRAWEVNTNKLELLGLKPSEWPVPLSVKCAAHILPSVPQLISTPQPQPLPLLPPARHKRPRADMQPQNKPSQPTKRKQTIQEKIPEKQLVCGIYNTTQNKPLQQLQNVDKSSLKQLDIWKKVFEDLKQLNSDDQISDKDGEVFRDIQKVKESVWELMKPHVIHMVTQDMFANSHLLASNGAMFRMVQMDPDSQLPSINFSLPNIPLQGFEVEDNNNTGTQQNRMIEEQHPLNQLNISPLNLPSNNNNQRPTSAPQFNSSQTPGIGVIAQGIIDYNSNKNNNNQQRNIQLTNGYFCSQDGSSGGPQRAEFHGATVTGTPAIEKNNQKNLKVVKDENIISNNNNNAFNSNNNNINCNKQLGGANNQFNGPQENDRNAGNNFNNQGGGRDFNQHKNQNQNQNQNSKQNQNQNQNGVQGSFKIDLQQGSGGGSPMTLTLSGGQQIDENMLRVVSQLMQTNQISSLQFNNN